MIIKEIGMEWPEVLQVFSMEVFLIINIVHGLRVINARVTNISFKSGGLVLSHGGLSIKTILPHSVPTLDVTVALKIQFYGLDRLGIILTRHILLELLQNALTEPMATIHIVVCAKKVIMTIERELEPLTTKSAANVQKIPTLLYKQI